MQRKDGLRGVCGEGRENETVAFSQSLLYLVLLQLWFQADGQRDDLTKPQYLNKVVIRQRQELDRFCFPANVEAIQWSHQWHTNDTDCLI